MAADNSAYVAPARREPRARVLLLHAWWGLNQSIKDFADKLASDGFTVLAPDLFEGVVLTTIEDADAHAQEMDAEYGRLLGLVGSSLDDLIANEDAHGQKAAIVALSFGAWYAQQIAESRSEVGALVSIYGDVFEGPEGVSYLGHFADNDRFVEAGAELQAAVDRGDAHVYPDTEHWFMERDRPEYNPAAAELAYRRTVDFLRKHAA